VRFESYFKLSSYLLVLCGFSSLVLTVFYSVPFGLFFSAVVVYSWNREKLSWKINLPKRAWNLITVGYFLYLCYEVFYASGDLVGEGINFTVYLQIHRLLNLKENRDYFLLYLLSFLHLLSASVLTESITFSIPFFVYIILATWTFTLYNIKSQYDESLGKDKKSQKAFYRSNTIITRRFLFATSILSLLIIASTMVIFFSFPRMSMGYFYKKIGSRKSISGFSERIDLGSIGSIIQNPAVVMRVEFPNKKISLDWLEEIYWRGTAFDNYDGRRWSHDAGDKERKLIDSMSGVLNLSKGKMMSNLLVQRIFLEPMETRIVFAADEVRMFRWEKLKLEKFLRRNIGIERDQYDTNYFFTNLSSDQKYIAYSELKSKTRYVPGTNDGKEWNPESAYLFLPYRNAQTEQLVTKIVSGLENDYEKAMKIMEYLQSNFKYSDQDLNVDSERPLEEFLFKMKRGHCEFFSTAMAILLRYVGIPSRNVVGFRGGAINEIGNYAVVRQSDAHSWAEAYIPGNGWLRFDPTPGEVDGEKRVSDGLGSLTKYVDYLKLRWNKYVIDYDLRAQAKYTRLFWAGTKKIIFTGSDLFEGRSNFANKLKSYSKNIKLSSSSIVIIAVCFGVIVFIVIFSNRRSFKRKEGGQKRKGRDFYSKMLNILSKKGIKKNSWETPFEFGKSVVAKQGNRYLSIMGITVNYYDTRFGDKALPKEIIKRVDAELERLKRI